MSQWFVVLPLSLFRILFSKLYFYCTAGTVFVSHGQDTEEEEEVETVNQFARTILNICTAM